MEDDTRVVAADVKSVLSSTCNMDALRESQAISLVPPERCSCYATNVIMLHINADGMFTKSSFRELNYTSPTCGLGQIVV
jgi:hypothetical protein